MQSPVFHAYPELRAEWNPERTRFQLALPWMQIEVEADADTRDAWYETTRRGEFPSAFLAFFAPYPVALECGPETRAALSAPAWSRAWDVEGVLSSARVGASDRYDPVAIYGLVRRLRLVSESEEESQGGLYRTLETLLARDEERFFAACRLVLRQTYAITSRCQESVQPAVEADYPFAALAAGFLREERGHENLVLQSLKALSGELDALPVLPETSGCMDLLRDCARSSPLAFACLVSVFEGLNFAEKDPLGRLLERSSRPAAARGIQRHFEINRDLEHSRVGEHFARTMGPVSREEAARAVRASEELVALGNRLVRELERMIVGGEVA